MNIQSRSRQYVLPVACALLLVAAVVPDAHATATSNEFQAPFLNLVRNILNLFNGGLARMLAMLAIIGLGLAAMVGRLTWGMAIRVVLGIVLVFGSMAIVGLITGNGGDTNFSVTEPPAAVRLA